MTTYAADLSAVEEAARRLAGWAHRTPVTTCATLDRLAGRRLFFKCENLQKSGSFKFRGACNAVRKLTPEEASRGVVTHSSGNHGQATALAARLRGIAAYVVMPRDSSPVKRRAVEGYGGRVIECEPTAAAREATAAAVLTETGGTMVPPYNHPDIIAAQGTAALELLEQAGELDAVVAPVGGGGLLAGTCIAAQGRLPSIRVIAAEPTGADDAARSKSGGAAGPADGAAHHRGRAAHRAGRPDLAGRARPGGARRYRHGRGDRLRHAAGMGAGQAADRAERRRGAGRRADRRISALAGLDRVGVILSGGNVDLDNLPWRLNAGPSR